MITHFLYESNQSGSTVNSILNYQPTLHFCSTNRYHRSMGYSTKDIFSESKLYAFRSKDIAQGFEMMKEEDSELNSSHGHKKSTTRYRIISSEIMKNRGTVSTKKGVKNSIKMSRRSNYNLIRTNPHPSTGDP